MGRRAIHNWRETNFKPRTQLLISFCHKPKSRETIGWRYQSEEAMGHFPSGQTKMDCVLGNKLQLAYHVHTKLLSPFFFQSLW
jgi:hypothetical protein